jgi:hypothetical protein
LPLKGFSTNNKQQQQQLQEDDKEWKFENLLQEVAQDINRELEAVRLVSKAVEEDDN